MPRPKGSKNKIKGVDDLIAQESQNVDALKAEIETVEGVVAEQTAKLKALKADLKKATKKIEGYEAQKAQEAAKAAAAAAKEALQGKIDELVNSGMSVEDILEKLK